MEGETEMNDVETVFLCLGTNLLRSSSLIYALRSEIEAVHSLSKTPERSPVDIDWTDVKSRLRIASNETEENRRALMEMGIPNYNA